MKVLYLTDQTYLHGGVEKVLSQKANWLANRSDDEVIIATYNQNGNQPVYPFSPNIRMLDMGVNYEIGKSYFDSINLSKIPKHRRKLQALFNEIQPDLVVSCSFGPDFYFLPFIGKSIPKIKEFHSSRFFYRKNRSIKDRILHRLSSIIEKKFECIVVLNEDERSFYTGDKVAVIPNPTELSEYRADGTSKKILAAGRISPVKNFGDLIESFAKAAKEIPDWELHFFGEDYLGIQAKLQSRTDELGLSHQIKFMGVTDDLKKEMQTYSIYAMTSETECFPMVLLESLSVGLPVISYNSPTGPKHIVTDGEDGMMVPYKNLDIFTEKLKLLMSNENLRQKMGENARENARRFEISKVMNQWKKLFHHLTQP
ncbi:glycosyltransferase family 4 protein [Chryseobacterium sp. R2A-55]|uniref:glycosyltransferase family 4 protein n=1 Tax=Chryseobacterium sp. R2A-55 TaxID=2744445 RepID=UPI001F197143|nr:glycosyltransferase family 4 protein [Chryseobacterium sp. R2A-55]